MLVAHVGVMQQLVNGLRVLALMGYIVVLTAPITIYKKD